MAMKYTEDQEKAIAAQGKVIVSASAGSGKTAVMIEKIIRLQGAVAGSNRSGRPEDQEKADGLRDILTELLEMREEWRHANCP